jgi:hypothetical protein
MVERVTSKWISICSDDEVIGSIPIAGSNFIFCHFSSFLSPLALQDLPSEMCPAATQQLSSVVLEKLMSFFP